ncbi:MAG: hypothetical protein LBT53_01010 [Puniceicoccales bacterium]|nr:hypothetical protein [Puniceicoccales bacterium]
MSKSPVHPPAAEIEPDFAQKTPLDHFVGVFALGATPILPLAAGLCAARVQDVFSLRIGEHLALYNLSFPALPMFLYGHFKMLCFGLFAVTFLLTFASWWQLAREKDPITRLGRQLVIAIASGIVGFTFIFLFVIATAEALFMPAPMLGR